MLLDARTVPWRCDAIFPVGWGTLYCTELFIRSDTWVALTLIRLFHRNPLYRSVSHEIVLEAKFDKVGTMQYQKNAFLPQFVEVVVICWEYFYCTSIIWQHLEHPFPFELRFICCAHKHTAAALHGSWECQALLSFFECKRPMASMVRLVWGRENIETY